MLMRVGKFLGTITPLISLIFGYQMLFRMKYTGATSESNTPQISTTIKVTALEFAFNSGSKVVIFWTIFWPIVIFILSCIGAFAVWKEKTILVWVIASVLLVISILSIMTIGRFVAPMGILFLVSAIILSTKRYEIS